MSARSEYYRVWMFEAPSAISFGHIPHSSKFGRYRPGGGLIVGRWLRPYNAGNHPALPKKIRSTLQCRSSTKQATCERYPTYVLEAKRLCKVFGEGVTRVTVLWEIDLQVRRGELLAIMGPSGSGKSTLLHLLGGVEPPTSGEVFWRARPSVR